MDRLGGAVSGGRGTGMLAMCFGSSFHRSAVDALGNNLLAGSMRMAWSDMAHSARWRFT